MIGEPKTDNDYRRKADSLVKNASGERSFSIAAAANRPYTRGIKLGRDLDDCVQDSMVSPSPGKEGTYSEDH